MNHLHYVPPPKGKSRRSAGIVSPRHATAIDGRRRESRVVVFEAVPTAREIIRVYVETIDHVSQEKVIIF